MLTLIGTRSIAAPTGEQVQALLNRATQLRKTEDFQQSNQLCQRALQLDPHNAQALGILGENYLLLGEYGKALPVIEQRTKWHPSDQPDRLLGLALVSMGQQRGVPILEQSYKTVPDHLTLLWLTDAYLLTGHYTQARTTAYEFRNAFPALRAGNEVCSLADALAQHYDESITNLGRFACERIRKRSELDDSHNPRDERTPVDEHLIDGAMSKIERDNFVKMLEAKHQQMSPAQLAFVKALVRIFAHDYNQAISLASSAPANARQPDADLIVIYALILKRDFPGAQGILDKLMARYPTSANVLDAVDLFHYQADSRQAGITSLKKLLEKNPKNLAAQVELIKIYRDIDRPEESLKYCKLALAQKPSDTELLMLQSGIFIRLDNDSAAMSTLNSALSSNKDNGEAYFMRASIYTQQQKWNEAIADLSQCIRLRYEVMKSLQARAACYSALHKDALAQKDYLEAQRTDRRVKHKEFWGY
jgi:tetratricopeptide (TPR) repeat protein